MIQIELDTCETDPKYLPTNLTELFFDELEKTHTTFKWIRVYQPGFDYNGHIHYVATHRMNTGYITEVTAKYDSRPYGQFYRHLYHKQLIKNLINECNSNFNGLTVAIYTLYGPNDAIPTNPLRELCLLLRYSIIEEREGHYA